MYISFNYIDTSMHTHYLNTDVISRTAESFVCFSLQSLLYFQNNTSHIVGIQQIFVEGLVCFIKTTMFF